MDNRVNSNNLPTEVSVWTKIRNFLCQDISLELTPKQEKSFPRSSRFLDTRNNWRKSSRLFVL